MKRRACQILLLLLVGAIINIAVAWGCTLPFAVPAYGPSDTWFARELRPGLIAHGRGFQRRGRGICAWFISDDRSISRNDRIYDNVPHAEDVLPYWARARLDPTERGTVFPRLLVASGWPLFSMVSDYRKAGHGQVPIESAHSGIQVSPHWILTKLTQRSDEPMVLPTSPIWMGFLLNTIFYACIAWGAWLTRFGVGALRRRRRNKRGLCPACGYDLRGSPTGACPECGTLKE